MSNPGLMRCTATMQGVTYDTREPCSAAQRRWQRVVRTPTDLSFIEVHLLDAVVGAEGVVVLGGKDVKDGVVVEVLQRPPVQVINLLSAKTQTAHRARPAGTRMLQPEHRTQQAHCSVLAWCSMEARGNTNHEHHKHLLRLFSSAGVGVVGGIHCSGSSLAAGATERCQLRQQATGPQLNLEAQGKAYASAKFSSWHCAKSSV